MKKAVRWNADLLTVLSRVTGLDYTTIMRNVLHLCRCLGIEFPNNMESGDSEEAR